MSDPTPDPAPESQAAEPAIGPKPRDPRGLRVAVLLGLILLGLGLWLVTLVPGWMSRGPDAQQAASPPAAEPARRIKATLFFVSDDGLRCPDGTTVPVGAVAIHSLRRLEGASDPADEVDVAAIEVPECGRGTVVLRHGLEASPAEAALLAIARDRRGSSGIPADMPSSELGPAPEHG